MELKDFINNVVDNQFMWAKGKSDVKDEPGIILKKSDIKVHITNEAIKKYNWETLIKQINAFDVYHVTRVVGYYSKTRNWNKSKIGELKDRGKGDYRI